MRSQLNDTADIVTTLDLAPPTKKLMHWKETGGVERLFSLMGRILNSQHLMKAFSPHLATKPATEEDIHVERAREDEEHESLVRESVARLDHAATDRLRQEIQRDKEGAVPSPVDSEYYGGPMTPFTPGPVTPGAVPLEELEDQVPVPAPVPDQPVEETPAPVDQHLQPPSLPTPQIDFSDIQAEPQPTPAPAPTLENQQQQQPGGGGLGQSIEQEEGETIEQFEERVATQRGQQMMSILGAALKHRDDRVGLFTLCAGNTRKQAASKFYSILVLKKTQMVEIQQDEAFGDVTISRGVKFTTRSTSSSLSTNIEA